MKSYLTTYLVLAGAIMLMGGLYFTRKIIHDLPASDDRWRIMYLLILFFIVGYLIFGVATYGDPFSFITFVVALIFCGVGGFVATVTFLSARTIDDVKRLTRLGLENSRVMAMQRRMETILDNAAEGIITFDRHGKIESINKATEKLFGYTGAEVIGHGISLLIPSPESRDKRQGYLEHFMRVEIRRLIDHESEVIGRHKDGTRFRLALKVSEIVVDEAPLYTALAADVGERKTMPDRLKFAAT